MDSVDVLFVIVSLILLMIVLFTEIGCAQRSVAIYRCDNGVYARTFIDHVRNHQPVAQLGEVCKQIT